jgi:hypothetical protein
MKNTNLTKLVIAKVMIFACPRNQIVVPCKHMSLQTFYTHLMQDTSFQIGALSLETGEEKLEMSATVRLPDSLHKARMHLIATTCSDKGCHLLFSGDDHSITLIQHPGKTIRYLITKYCQISILY